MKLNRTPNPLDRSARNGENDNWDIIEGEVRAIGDRVDNFVDEVSDAAFDKVVDNAKINWKEPVDNFNSLPSNAKNGDTRMDRSTGKVYRYDGTNWVEIQQIDAGPVNELDSRLSSQLAEKANQTDVRENTWTRPINVSEMDTETKQLFTGGAVAVVGENSVGKENIKNDAVHLEHAAFTFKTKNLFEGYVSKMLFAVVADNTLYMRNNYSNYVGTTAIVPIEPNKTYTVKIHDPEMSELLRIGITNQYPTFSDTNDKPTNHVALVNSTSKEYTFTNTADGKYALIYVSNTGKEPRIQIEEGETANEYTPGRLISEEYLPKKDVSFNEIQKVLFTKKSKKNLFDGKYVDGLLYGRPSDRILVPITNYSTFKGKVAIVPIEANKQYTIKVHEPDKQTHLRIGIADVYPTFTNTGGAPSDSVPGLATTVNYNTLYQEYTFTNTATGKFVCVYVSNNGQEPLLQIEEGSVPTEFTPYYVMDSHYIELPNEEKDVTKESAKYNFYVNLETFYTHSEIIDYIENPSTLTVSEYHQMFNNLISKNADISKATLLGQTEFGYDLYKYENTPIPYKRTATEGYGETKPKTDISLPKIVITAGVHGREKAASYACYYFFREMLENPNDNPILDFLKRNIHLIFVPVICASGFEDNTYENRNGQNLNRDFAPYGSFTQAETRLVKKVIDENSDMDFHLDFHTTPLLDDPVGYTLTNDESLALIGNNMYRQLGREWQKRYPSMPQNINHEWGYTTPANVGTAGLYSELEHGVQSTIFEVVWRNKWLDGNVYHSEYVTRMGVEILANMIIGALRSRQ